MRRCSGTATGAGIAACVLALAAFLLFGKALLHPSLVLTSPRSDYTGFLLPRAGFVAARILDSGGIPLWRPAESCGVPTLGNPQIGVFYPPNLLVLLMGPLRSLAPRFMLCLFIAGFSAWAYCRQTGMGGAGSILAGLAFMLSGFFSSNVYAGHLQHLSAVAWFPALLFFADRLASRPRAADAAGLAVCLALQFTAGHPEYSAYGALAAALYFACAWLRAPRGAAILAVLLALALFPALAAVQLLPTAEFARLMTRGREGYAFASGGSLSPFVLPTFLMPDLLGRLALNAWRGPGFYWEQCGFLGLTVLLLAASGARAGGRARILLALAVFSLLFALGSWTPFHRACCALAPPLMRFRVPSRMLHVYAFCVSVLAGMGLDRLAARGPGRRFRIVAAAFCLVPAAGIALVRFLPGPAVACGERIVRWRFGLDAGGSHTMPLEEWLALVPRVHAVLAAGAGFGTVAAAGAFLVLLLLLHRGVVSGKVFAPCAVALACAELFAFALPLVRLSDPGGLHPSTGAVALMARDRSLFRFMDLSGRMGLERVEPYGIESAFNFESGFIRWYAGALALVRFRISPLSPGGGLDRLCGDFDPVGGDGLPDTPLRLVNRTTRYRVGDFTAALNGLNLLNVKYLALNNPVVHPALKPVWTDNDIFLYRNRAVLPRAFVAHAVETVPDPDRARARLASFDPTASVVLAEGPAPPCGPGEFSPASVLSYEPDRVVLEADGGRGGGVLVLLDLWYPGWEAYENGARRGVLMADGAFRGVPVGPGRRVVEFRYAPRPYRRGRALSVFGALAALAAVLAGRRRRG